MIYKIHPAIGIARVGTSEEYYIAPETPGGLPILPDGKSFQPQDFRDGKKLLRRQAARFEVYQYDTENHPGKPLRAGENGVARVEWTVHVANKKPIWYTFLVNSGENGYPPGHSLRNAEVVDPGQRTKMIIDPGPRTLTGPNQHAEFSRNSNAGGYPMTWPPEGLKPFAIDTLGGIHTDDLGRLLVRGGKGHSGSSLPPVIEDYANNEFWWDDTSDGTVKATVVMQDGRRIELQSPSWVITAPPRYAPQLVNIVSLYDTIFDTFVRNRGLRPDIFFNSLWNRDFSPSWEKDVQPILERAHRYPWVSAIPPHAHDFDFDKLGDPSPQYQGLRQFYLQIIRPSGSPDLLDSETTGYPMMPLLCGDNCFEPGPMSSTYLTVTSTQYFYLLQWAAGKFTRGAAFAAKPGEVLDRAALENCVGGAFSPGIEMTWVSRNPDIYESPFRIKARPNVKPPLSLGGDFALGLEPGDATKYMAVPWQADFNECSQQQIGERYLFWWPVQRPSTVWLRQYDRLKQVAWVGTESDQNAPDYIQFADDLDMVKLWSKLGFIFNEGTKERPEFVEVERILPRTLQAGAGGS